MTPGRRSPIGSGAAALVAAGLRRCRHDELGIEAAIGAGRLLDQLRDAHAGMQRIGLGRGARQLLQDLAAASRLRLQERQVLGQLAPRRGVPRQLLGDHGDGRERRAELVRRRGGETVERVQLLLARQHHLGGGQRVRHLPRLLGEPPGIERQEDHARQHRGQEADVVEQSADRRWSRGTRAAADGRRPAAPWRPRPTSRARWCCAAAAWRQTPSPARPAGT